jgi:uncharacterized membrane protein
MKAGLAAGRAMRFARLASWALLVAGLASLGYAGVNGDVDVFLVFVVPVVAASGPWAGLGLLATVAGAAGLLWTSVSSRIPSTGRGPGSGPRPPGSEGSRETRETETRGGGVILIGPIPIAWGSDRSTLGWLVAGGIALTLAAIGLALVMRP